MKFGGTSVANADRITELRYIVAQQLNTTPRVVVVVSALGGLTDQLIAIARMAEANNEQYKIELQTVYERHRTIIYRLFTPETKSPIIAHLQEKTDNLEKLLYGVSLIRELSDRTLDTVMSYGELMSSFIISHYLSYHLTDVQFIDPRTLIATDSDFGNAKIDFDKTNRQILKAVAATTAKVYVMGGFVASNSANVTTTLGRGGSDYTAAIVGATLDATEIQIWTDVNGVMTADPRKVKKAFTLADMTYEEAFEMSYFGAKVIHPPTIQPALEKQIPIRILNSFDPTHTGTLIAATSADYTHPVKGISSMSQISLVTLQGTGMKGVMGIAGRLFTTLARQRINIILITQASSEHSISFVILPKDANRAQTAINSEFEPEMRAHLIDPVIIENELSVIAVIGSNMRNSVGVSGRMFNSLARNGVNIRAIAQGSSELNISAVVSKQHEIKSLNALHEAFFLSDTQTLNVFMTGIGLIGKTLLKQINEHAAYLLEKQSLEIKVIALSNSREMLMDEEGIDLTKWDTNLAQEGEKADIKTLVQRMIELNLPNSIFVDCTANKLPVTYYETVLGNSIAVVTPNKIANSGSLASYLRYKQLSKRYGKFMYETNVGAGLPIIGTLNNLLQSGDEVLKIEAILSGSLSFIFNNFDNTQTFSQIVRQAKELGYTEPDPRDDLSGLDVARKVLILARETGAQIELSDIIVENPLPDDCQQATSIDDFFVALAANDSYFSDLYQNAAAEGKVLRFLATIEGKHTTVGLRQVPKDSPFATLSGSDNMVVFTTNRYSERPLVVKGPGAGAEVTAAGVFAEIIQLGK